MFAHHRTTLLPPRGNRPGWTGLATATLSATLTIAIACALLWPGGPGYGTGGVRNPRIDPVTWIGNTVHVRGPSTTPEPDPPAP